MINSNEEIIQTETVSVYFKLENMLKGSNEYILLTVNTSLCLYCTSWQNSPTHKIKKVFLPADLYP